MTGEPNALRTGQETEALRWADGSLDSRRMIFPSPAEAERFLDNIRGALEVLQGGDIPEMSSIAWPEWLDRGVLVQLPLKTRTRNCLRRDSLLEGSGALTVFDLVRLPQFGRACLFDLLLELERYLKACIRGEVVGTNPWKQPSDDAAKTESLTGVRIAKDAAMPGDWERAASVLNSLLAAAAELRGVETFADALSGDLVELARKMGIISELEGIRVENLLAGLPGPASVAVGRLENTLAAMSTSERMVIEQRLLHEPPATLAEVGSLVDVSRERIRQVQVKVEKRVAKALGPEVRLVGSLLNEELGSIIDERAFTGWLNDRLGTGTTLAHRLLRKAIVAEMGYSLRLGTYVDQRAQSVISEIRARGAGIADDVGLVDEPRLRAGFPDEDWQLHWTLLRRHVNLHELHGCLAIRDSAKARAKSALVSIGRPATLEEVAAVCGLGVRQAAGAFSNIPSVARASKHRWALKEWVDDEYEGIVAEIIQRIEEDGGSTTVERLLTELPERFGVSKSSVRSYMKTPRFAIRDGRIGLASKSLIRLRPLDDVVHGRDTNGEPFWTFTVESRFFEGFSVMGVPPEFAKALGCEPDGRTYARIENLPTCRELSVRWPLATTTGASLGYLADPLRKLGIQSGQRVRVTLKGRNLVEMYVHHDSSGPATERQANTILARMKNRRRVL